MTHTDLRNQPALSNIPPGGLDLIPGKRYPVFFSPEDRSPDYITVTGDGSASCTREGWKVVTGDSKIIGLAG
jgi:hypothetical protein